MFIDTIAFLTISTIIHNSKLFCHVYMYALRNNLDKYFKNNLQLCMSLYKTTRVYEEYSVVHTF